MILLTVNDYKYPQGWVGAAERDEQEPLLRKQLEEGRILFFDDLPFNLPEEDRKFLLSQQSGDSRIHKNVSYRPEQDILRGFSSDQKETSARVHEIMRRYSAEVTRFLSDFLVSYKDRWSLDFASYRPLEEEGRNLSLHKRNDLLHVDAFPSRPTKGGRILRVFTNINPTAPRIWHTTESFAALAARFADDAGLKRIAARSSSTLGSLQHSLRHLARALGLPLADRSAYDHFMLRFHDYLKENAEFQNNCPKIRLEFPAGSTWIVYTDAVAHAALSGCYALEQTYIIPTDALLSPEKAPLHILESLCGCSLSA